VRGRSDTGELSPTAEIYSVWDRAYQGSVVALRQNNDDIWYEYDLLVSVWGLCKQSSDSSLEVVLEITDSAFGINKFYVGLSALELLGIFFVDRSRYATPASRLAGNKQRSA